MEQDNNVQIGWDQRQHYTKLISYMLVKVHDFNSRRDDIGYVQELQHCTDTTAAWYKPADAEEVMLQEEKITALLGLKSYLENNKTNMGSQKYRLEAMKVQSQLFQEKRKYYRTVIKALKNCGLLLPYQEYETSDTLDFGSIFAEAGQ